jgi:lipopolysaccharide/colanic/teichoic acid biosynthesis glycosyltransferase
MIQKILKRSLDIVGAFVGVIIILPVWLILPILIKLDSRGPVFYTQTRVGVNRRRKTRRFFQKEEATERRSRERRRQDYLGRTFKVIKFRTMRHKAENETGPVWATRNDPRITRLGLLMRRTRLDELPQLLNILKGDMSLVGPRPERPAFVRELIGQVEGYSDRLTVKPGLTGLAQVESGYDSSIASVAEKVMYDLEYIRKQSFLMDLRILCKTVIVVLTGRGAC